MTEDVDGLPERMRQVRAHWGLTTLEMATRLGLRDRKTWERYERGDTRANTDVMAALYDSGIDIHWLLTGAGQMERVAPSQAGAAETEDDQLYETAIATTLHWYERAGMQAEPEGLAGMISRAVRMVRRPGGPKAKAEVAAEVERILDIARDMAAAAGRGSRRG